MSSIWKTSLSPFEKNSTDFIEVTLENGKVFYTKYTDFLITKGSYSQLETYASSMSYCGSKDKVIRFKNSSEKAKRPVKHKSAAISDPQWKINRDHTMGIDVIVPDKPIGEPVYAAAAGLLILKQNSKSAGNYVEVYHGLFDRVVQLRPKKIVKVHVRTRYMHFSKFGTNLIPYRTWVNNNTILGYVGNTGYSTGPHLHFEVRGSETSALPSKYGIKFDANGALTRPYQPKGFPKEIRHKDF